jgi:hypothetical protein
LAETDLSLIGSRIGSIDCDDDEFDDECIFEFDDTGNADGSDREASVSFTRGPRQSVCPAWWLQRARDRLVA